MRVAFDVSPLSHPLLGIGNYIRGSLGGLVEAAGGEHEVVAFAPTSVQGPDRIRAALEGIDVELRTWRLPFSHAVRTAWSSAGHPAAERLLGAFDVLHFSDWMYPPQRAGVRATTIHDLVPLHHPEWTTARTRSMHGRKYRNTAETCDVVFVNSAFTGRDVTATLGVPAERIRVARPAPKPVFRPDGPGADLGAPYVLTVATLEPRKNLQVLVEAQRLLGGDVQLAVAGAEGWGEQPLLDGPGIRRLGYVPDEELARLYRGAAAVAYPSRFEGFGIPVLEAMACGVPVVVSSHESLDEASGSAALRADPDDAAAFARAIAHALGERDRLVAAGLEHVRGFSWRAVGETFLRGYAEASRVIRPEEVLVVVYRPGPEFLVALRSPERHGYWNPIAGGVEEGEEPEAAARRELAEESGLEEPLRFERIPLELGYVRPEGMRVALHGFLAEAPAAFEPVLDDEHVDYRWCSAEEAAELLSYPEPREAYAYVARLLEGEA